MAKRQENKKFKVGNIEIVIGDRYVLDGKLDPNAPEALQKIESTKFPFSGSGVYDCINFDENRRMFDTGFYKESLCLSQYKEEEKEELVRTYINRIKKPFEESRGGIDLSPNENNEFWSSWRYEAYANKEFDTKDPVQLMELFQIIMQGVACEKNEKNHFYRKNAQFVVSNPSAVKNKEKEKSKTRAKALKSFSILLDGDRDKLDLILEYIGKENTSKVQKDDLESIYFELFTDKKAGFSLAEDFLNACDEYETEEGKLKMEFFYAINKLFKLRKIIKNNRGYITTDGELLGNTLQDVAKFCLITSSKQYKIIDALIDENPSVRREIKTK